MKKEINVPPFLSPEENKTRAETSAPKSAQPSIGIGIDLPPIEIEPPDLGDIPIAIDDEEPPHDFHHDDERDNDPELGDPRDDLDPGDFPPPDDDPSDDGGGPGGGGVRGGGGGGGG